MTGRCDEGTPEKKKKKKIKKKRKKKKKQDSTHMKSRNMRPTSRYIIELYKPEKKRKNKEGDEKIVVMKNLNSRIFIYLGTNVQPETAEEKTLSNLPSEGDRRLLIVELRDVQ